MGAPAHPHAPAATPEQIERALAEARSVTSVESAGQIELQLGHFCNNRCVFCGSGQLTERGQADPVAEEALLAALEAAADRGLRRVTFLGGEPTIQDSFLPGLRRAVALGFAEIVIFTNGARLWDPRFVDEVEAVVAAAPVALHSPVALQWRVSLQGADAPSHDRAVGRPGAFARILKGFEVVQARGRDLTVNMCLTAGSLATLPDLAELLVRYGVRQLCIDMVRPISAGERTEEWMRAILPRFQDIGPPLRELTRRLRAVQADFDVNYTHVPFCVAPDLAPLLHHGGEPTVTFTADLAERQGVMDKYAFQSSDRRKVDGCKSCVFAWRCTGVPHQYLDWYGDAELTPLRPADLLGLGVEQAALIDMVHSQLPDLQAQDRRDLPVGLTAATFDPRQSRAELRWRLGNSACSLWIVPASQPCAAGRWPFWQFPGGRVDLEPHQGGPDQPQLQTLAAWLHQHLGGQFASDPLDFQKVLQQRAWLLRALQRVQKAMPQLQMHMRGGLVELQLRGSPAPLGLRVAADGQNPVAWREFLAGVDSQAPALLQLSRLLAQALRQSRLR